MRIHIPTPYIHTLTLIRTDRWADRHIRKKQRTKDGRRKTEDGSVRVNRKKQGRALTSTLSTFVPSLLCSKLGHRSSVYDFESKVKSKLV